MILAKIKKIVDQQFIYEGELNERTKVIDDLGADSLDIPVMVNAIEDEFAIAISNEELFKIRTIGDLMNIIQDKIPEGMNYGKC
ncbi:acyl carrier protein [Desulfosporosinus meridiei]|uniref:Acyl carrier protein n=1 Tax=Desulfosporosinus meridiei (strain ATCC BAA-275 / DSM 13257 / KCTC 12902 / NCIMB 13706 / S10) TaxID=768704 RepID=J7IWK2_DESMD|nr:acyl carrier protein [Desulfosporosinus meridiei]AFQ46212.1 acyl carrier protein [Desulfosporosinus meridiei DSM 13257]